jgi:hypothetical protein
MHTVMTYEGTCIGTGELRPDMIESLRKRAVAERQWFVEQRRKGMASTRQTTVIRQTLDPVWQQTFTVCTTHVCVLMRGWCIRTHEH